VITEGFIISSFLDFALFVIQQFIIPPNQVISECFSQNDVRSFSFVVSNALWVGQKNTGIEECQSSIVNTIFETVVCRTIDNFNMVAEYCQSKMVENREEISHALTTHTIICWLQGTNDLREIWNFFKRFNQAKLKCEEIVNIGNVVLKLNHINVSKDFFNLKKIAEKIFSIVSSSTEDERKVINIEDFENFLINLHYADGFLILAGIFDKSEEQKRAATAAHLQK